MTAALAERRPAGRMRRRRRGALRTKTASREIFAQPGRVSRAGHAANPRRTRENDSPVRQLTSGPAIYAYVRGNPISFTDPWGLTAYNATQTSQLLGQAYVSATSGPLSGLVNIYRNSVGQYDFGWNDPDQSDTWCVNGRTLNVDQMGNFIAGFEGQAYDQTFNSSSINALQLVIEGGIAFHQTGRTKSVNDPNDLTGYPDIISGAAYARTVVSPTTSAAAAASGGCGCGH
jgi:hypothetical protein